MLGRTYRMVQRLAAAAGCAMVLSGAGFATGDEPIDMSPRWEPGQGARYEVWTSREQHVTASVAGERQEMGFTLENEGEVSWHVQQVHRNGGASVQMVIDWLRVTMTGPEGDRQVVDSRQGSGDVEMLHDAVRAMTGVELDVRIAPDGSVEDVGGVAALRRAAPAAEAAPDERDLRELAGELAALAGAGRVSSVGERWEVERVGNHELGTLYRDITYQLDEVGQIEGVPIATVLGTGRLDLDIEPPPEGGPPMDLRVTEASYDSQVLFDLDRREAVGRNSVQRIEVDITVELPENQSIHQQIRETVHSQALRIEEYGS